jgi:acyl-CoA reductase-like NAD-dependent aldehyde dehydrogenase
MNKLKKCYIFQSCICPNRFFIHEDLFDSFVEKVVARIKKDIKMGDGFDPKVNMGPLINQAQVKKVCKCLLIEEAYF